jgi:hypothetical protein
MYDHVGLYACLRRVRDLINGHGRHVTREAGTKVAKLDDGSVVLRILRSRLVKQLVCAIDLAIFPVYRFYQEILRGRVLILDRYFYDSIVDLAEGADNFSTQNMTRWVLTPDLPIYVEASPETAFARKAEYSIDHLRVRQRLYKELFLKVDGALLVPNQDMPQACAVEAIAARLGSVSSA